MWLDNLITRMEAFGSRLVSRRLHSLIKTHEYFLLISVLMVLLRIPNLFEPYWYGDEGIYLTIGQAMGRDVPLYAGIIDHKTPLIYVWAWLAQTLVWFKMQLLFLSLVALVCFYGLAKKLLVKERTALGATLVFMLFTTLPAFEGNIANGELFLMPFILAGMWILVHKLPIQKPIELWPKKLEEIPATVFFGAGGLMALGLLTKVPAGFDFGAVVVFWLFLIPVMFRVKKMSLWFSQGIYLAGGFCLPIMFSMVYFAVRGHLGEYFDFGLLYNFRYIQAWNQSFGNPLIQFLVSMPGRLVILVGLLGIVYWQLYRERPGVPLVMIWFLMTLFASILSLRPYPHYFIQLIPPLVLLLGLAWEGTFRTKLAGLGAVIILGIVFTGLGFERYPTVAYYSRFLNYLSGRIDWPTYANGFDARMELTEKIAEWLREHTAMDEKVFIWGNEPNVYALSQRSPVGRYTVAFHVESFGSYEETMRALELQRPRYVIDTQKQTGSFGELYAWLSNDYVLTGRVGDADIYRRWYQTD